VRASYIPRSVGHAYSITVKSFPEIALVSNVMIELACERWTPSNTAHGMLAF
jgi:hypothetical protein